MVLDKKLNGILDQGAGDLILFDQVETDVRLVLCAFRPIFAALDLISGSPSVALNLYASVAQKTYEDALATIKEMGGVVDKLYSRAGKLN